MSLSSALAFHCGIMTVALAAAAVYLRRRGLLTILSSGAWVIFAFALYFVFNPAVSLFTNNLHDYREALVWFSGGGSIRVFWILAVILAGLGTYLYFYTRGGHAGGFAPFTVRRWSLPQIATLGAFLGFALYSILFVRTGGEFVRTTVSAQFNKGRIVGGVTGYSVVAHSFFLFIVVLLLVRGPRRARWLGAWLGVLFVVLSMYDAYDRAGVVSFIAGVGMVALVRGAQRAADLGRPLVIPRFKVALLMAAAGVMALFLVLRGHVSLAEMHGPNLTEGETQFQENDTAMLPTLYEWSYAYEHYGYDYGLPLVNSALFGWLPRRYFPWKDDLPNIVLGRKDIRYSGLYDRWFVGPKATVLGTFYGHGGLIGVVLGMAVLGAATRRLDWLVAKSKSDLSRSVGIAWMASLWMMLGSGDVWILSSMFVNGLPFFGVWVVAKLEGSRGPPADAATAINDGQPMPRLGFSARKP